MMTLFWVRFCEVLALIAGMFIAWYLWIRPIKKVKVEEKNENTDN